MGYFADMIIIIVKFLKQIEVLKRRKVIPHAPVPEELKDPTTSVVSRLTTLVRIVKSIEVPTLIGNMTD